MMDTRLCIFCGCAFTPNKYSPKQKICSAIDCQKKRQLESMKLWRQRNPSYFKYDESKGLVWLETQRKRSKTWREKNPEKVRTYRQTHSLEYRQYMKEYMRQYRDRKKVSGQMSQPEGGEPHPPTQPNA